MNKILLIIRPNYDDATEYLAYYSSIIIKNAETLGIEEKDFTGKEITNINITKFIQKKDPKLILINGHGNETCILGNKEVLFSEDKNIELLKNRIIYARACHAGVSFGKKVTENSGGCFIGYNFPFAFVIDDKWSAVPSRDKTAALFLEPSNEVINSLMKGDSAKIANGKSKNAIIKNMQKVIRMEENKEPGAMNLLRWLWNNYEGQILHGNQDITF